MVETTGGGVLGAVAPLAFAAAAGTALVIDLENGGPPYPGGGSLASLVEDGPRLTDLRPSRSGIAVLRNGGVDAAEASEVIEALTAGWPNVVLRGVPGADAGGHRVVPVIPLLPHGMTRSQPGRAVYQQMGWHEKGPEGGVTLPTPSRATVSALLAGRVPARSRWIRSWRPVWELPWA